MRVCGREGGRDVNKLPPLLESPRAFIRVSEDLRHLVISRCDFLYPHQTADGSGARDEARFELLGGCDGDILLSFGDAHRDARDAAAMLTFAARAAQPVPAAVAGPTMQVTEEMHAAAVKVLLRAPGLDGLPQRMLNAMLATAPTTQPAPQQEAQEPFGYVNTKTGQFFADVEPCRKNNEGHWRTVYVDSQPSPAEQGDALRVERDEMLEALQAVASKLVSRPYGTGSYLPKPLRDQVFAAIAKATGQEGGAQ